LATSTYEDGARTLRRRRCRTQACESAFLGQKRRSVNDSLASWRLHRPGIATRDTQSNLRQRIFRGSQGLGRRILRSTHAPWSTSLVGQKWVASESAWAPSDSARPPTSRGGNDCHGMSCACRLGAGRVDILIAFGRCWSETMSPSIMQTEESRGIGRIALAA